MTHHKISEIIFLYEYNILLGIIILISTYIIVCLESIENFVSTTALYEIIK